MGIGVGSEKHPWGIRAILRKQERRMFIYVSNSLFSGARRTQVQAAGGVDRIFPFARRWRCGGPERGRLLCAHTTTLWGVAEPCLCVSVRVWDITALLCAVLTVEQEEKYGAQRNLYPSSTSLPPSSRGACAA